MTTTTDIESIIVQSANGGEYGVAKAFPDPKQSLSREYWRMALKYSELALNDAGADRERLHEKMRGIHTLAKKLQTHAYKNTLIKEIKMIR